MVAVPATGKILYLPVRPTMLPLPIDVMSIPATIGRVRRPEVVAETPSTNCMNVGRKVSAPSIAKPTMKPRMQQTVNTGLANSRMGRIGSAARVSTQTKTASAAAEADEQADDHRGAPRVLAAAPAGGQGEPRGAEADEQDAGVVDDRPGGLGQRRDRRGPDQQARRPRREC